MRDRQGAPARGRARHGGARRHLRPVSVCDCSVMCCGPDHVPNSAAAASNGQSGICRHRDEDESSSMFFWSEIRLLLLHDARARSARRTGRSLITHSGSSLSSSSLIGDDIHTVDTTESGICIRDRVYPYTPVRCLGSLGVEVYNHWM